MLTASRVGLGWVRGETREEPQVPGAGCLACLPAGLTAVAPEGPEAGLALLSVPCWDCTLFFLSQQTEGEAATGCKGGLGVILGCRAWQDMPRMAGGGVGGVWDQGIVRPLLLK